MTPPPAAPSAADASSAAHAAEEQSPSSEDAPLGPRERDAITVSLCREVSEALARLDPSRPDHAKILGSVRFLLDGIVQEIGPIDEWPPMELENDLRLPAAKQLVHALFKLRQEQEDRAISFAFPEGIPWQKRYLVVREALDHLRSYYRERPASWVLALCDCLENDLNFRRVMFSKATETALARDGFACHVCAPDRCSGGEEHDRRWRLLSARAPLRHHDLIQLTDKEKIAEIERLRRFVSPQQAFPDAPPWVAEAQGYFSNWDLVAGPPSAPSFQWRDPQGRRSLFRRVGDENWHAEILAEDGQVSTLEDPSFLHVRVFFGMVFFEREEL